MSLSVIVREARLDDEEEQRGLLALLDRYATEPGVGASPLAEDVRATLIAKLRAIAGGHYFVALEGPVIVGLALCFNGFSTFHARPLLNLHDLAVHPDHRGNGIGQRLLLAVEERAKALGCCRVTLEVHATNPARRLYERFGFEGAESPGQTTLFLTKPLQTS